MTVKQEIAKYLLQWYDLSARDLPWRKDKNFYHVWLSEIMLQQTRVEAVIPYYYRFLKHAPDIAALATLDEEVLLKLWEGLGYYQRVRNLQKAAKQLHQLPPNQWPKTKEALQMLPGIGPYTSGAIASIVFEENVAAIDGNVLRVMARILGIKDSIKERAIQKIIEQNVLDLLPDKRVGDFNQALMELGATICIPTGSPRCEICPLKEECTAFKNNMQNLIPYRSKKTIQQEESYWLLVLQHQDTYAIKKRDNQGVLRGLWGFILLPKDIDVTNYLKQNDIPFHSIQDPIYEKHIFTHKIWHLYMHKIKVTTKPQLEDMIWVSLQQLVNFYSLPTAFRKFIKHL